MFSQIERNKEVSKNLQYLKDKENNKNKITFDTLRSLVNGKYTLSKNQLSTILENINSDYRSSKSSLKGKYFSLSGRMQISHSDITKMLQHLGANVIKFSETNKKKIILFLQ